MVWTLELPPETGFVFFFFFFFFDEQNWFCFYLLFLIILIDLILARFPTFVDFRISLTFFSLLYVR